jgi:hypothetical protein
VNTVPDVPNCFYNLKTIKCQVKVNDGQQLTPKFAYFMPKSCIGSNLLVNNLKNIYIFTFSNFRTMDEETVRGLEDVLVSIS